MKRPTIRTISHIHAFAANVRAASEPLACAFVARAKDCDIAGLSLAAIRRRLDTLTREQPCT